MGGRQVPGQLRAEAPWPHSPPCVFLLRKGGRELAGQGEREREPLAEVDVVATVVGSMGITPV